MSQVDETAMIRDAIERVETQERELMAANAELEHAGRRINDQLERLGGRDPESERKRRELREVIAVNAKARQQLLTQLQALRGALAESEKSIASSGTGPK